ncbi:MAG: NAD(P)H-hydrate dehydratase [Woeseia sp.]
MELPAEIYSASGARQLDRKAIDGGHVEGYTLMNRAARAALALALREFPQAHYWQIVCGAGNNGGDGFVLGRLAMEQGMRVTIAALVAPETLQGDAARAWRDFAAAGGRVTGWEGELDPDAELLVDAILGSGLTRNVEGPFAEAIVAICRHEAAVLALDIPSGVSADSGEVLGCAVRADHTITFAGLKSGLFLGNAPDFVGTLSFAGLDLPPACRQEVKPKMRRIGEDTLARNLAARPRSAHKGDFGHLLLVGGAPGMAGAIRLAGDAALRCGAGRVSIATHPAHCDTIVASRPELMCHAVTDGRALGPLLERATTVAAGPGLGTDEWGRELLQAVLSSDRPLVLDADALNLLAQQPRRRDSWILTPHPGEAARLLGSTPGEIQANRLHAVGALAERYGGVIVLKGAGTLVHAGDGPPWLCTAGNPGMAGPGMGDALTGIIGSLLAQGLPPGDAAVTGVEVHARAGDAAAGEEPRGLIASDLVAALRRWVNP